MSKMRPFLATRFAHSRNTSKDLRTDLKTITRYLHNLQSSDTKPQPLTLTSAPEIATQLNELVAELYPAATDKAQ